MWNALSHSLVGERTQIIFGPAAIVMEPLDARRLLSSVYYNPDTGVLEIEGNNNQDWISVIQYPGGQVSAKVEDRTTLNVVGGASPPGVAPVRIEILGLGEMDRIIIEDVVTVPAVVNGGDATDEIQGGSANDTLTGGQGNDIIRGGDGNDHLLGLEDEDQLFGEDGDDLLMGGDARDELHLGLGYDKAYGDGGNDYIFDTTDDCMDSIFGGEGTADTIVGHDAGDLLDGIEVDQQ